MIPNQSFNVATAQVSTLPIQLCQIEGYFRGAANSWLQVFDSCTTPAAAAVPVYQLPINATSQFAETLQIGKYSLGEGLFVGISTTEGTWTASAEKMDVVVWTDVPPVSTTILGNKTSVVNNLPVWTEATGAACNSFLYGTIITNATGATLYALIYADVTPFDYGVYQSIITVPDGKTVKSYFGDQGLVPFSQELPATMHLGCKIFLSSTVPTTGGALTAVNGKILAITN